MSASKKPVVHKAKASLTPKSDTKPVTAVVDDSSRLKEIRALVKANNKSEIPEDVVICQIYMESRFDKDAKADGSSARGLMQLLKVPVRELYRIDNLAKPRADRKPDAEVYRDADVFHDSAEMVDEATNIQWGTRYLQLLIDRQRRKGAADPIDEAYKDYRGLRNGVYYRKIKAGAEALRQQPDSMAVLRDMVK